MAHLNRLALLLGENVHTLEQSLGDGALPSKNKLVLVGAPFQTYCRDALILLLRICIKWKQRTKRLAQQSQIDIHCFLNP